MTVVTYPAIIRNGKAEPVAPLELPEGSRLPTWSTSQPVAFLRAVR